MLESILTVSIAGLLAGFIFSMPVAGPISILITSNALKGRLRYCNLVNLGASLADFTYVFVAVFGLTKLYSFYKPLIPYIFSVGSLLLLFLGYKVFKTKIDIDHLEDKLHLTEKIKKRERGALTTGFLINILNPTLFIGWLTSSLLVITLLSSMGFYTGGLAKEIGQSVDNISSIDGTKIERHENNVIGKLDQIQIMKNRDKQEADITFPVRFHLLISICYAFFIALGSISWFLILAYFVVRHRKRINIKFITSVIKIMGVVLCSFGLYFGYAAVKMFF